MSLKSKIEAVIYASEEPVTLVQLVVLLSEEVQLELDAISARQESLQLEPPLDPDDLDATRDSAGPVAADAGTNAEMAADGDPDVVADPGVIADPSEPPVADQAGIGEAPADAAPDKRLLRERERAVRDYLRSVVDTLIREYADADRGLEIREVAGGYRFGTKPEYHDAVRGFVKSLKPALKLTLQALETLAVVAYKQPVTAAEISEIRGVDSAGVLGGLLTRKLIQTAGRKQVIGRPMLYKTTREFLVRFGLRDVQELPSMEEFERMAGELSEQEDLPMEDTGNIIERANARGDAEHIRQQNEDEPAASPLDEVGETAPSNDAPAARTGQSAAVSTPVHDDDAETNVPAETGNSSVEAEAHPTGQESA